MKPKYAILPGWAFMLILAGVLLPGCVHYKAKPLDAAGGLEALYERSLSDPGLQKFIETKMSGAILQWPPATWDLQRLTLAAFYFNPELDVARAKLAEAEAARITAGERSNPALSFSSGYNASTPSGVGVSPWILGIAFDMPLETAGKRGLRLSEAGYLSDAARLRLAGTAWEIRFQVRQAFVDLWTAREAEALFERKLTTAAELARIAEARLSAGDIDQSELMSARLLEQQARLENAAAGGESDKALVQLAISEGLASHTLDGVKIDFAGFEMMPEEIPSADARRSALLNRADILSALASYAASEAALQKAIAGQYPDISLGPGYEYDQGDNKWSIGFQLTLPVLNRNRGAIAEAEAKRKAAAAEFTSLQSNVLGDTEKAVVSFQAAQRRLADAEAMLEQARQQVEVVEKQFTAGAVSKQAVLSSRLEKISAELIRLDSRTAAQTSLGKLEYTLQTPLDSTRFPAILSLEEK